MPHIQQLRDRWHSNSARTRARIGPPLRRAYGPSAIEQLDIFRTDAPAPAPVFVFIHGGAWRAGSASQYSAPAEMFVRAGAHYVAPDFDDGAGCRRQPVPDGRAGLPRDRLGLPQRRELRRRPGAGLCRRAFVGRASRRGGADDRLGTRFGLPPDIIKGGLCGSGMYDLYPVSLSHRSSYVRFTDEMIEKLSPLRHIARLHAPVIVAYGTDETPEFQRQARDFAAALRDAGKQVELLVGEHYSHLDLPETLCNPYGLLGAAVLGQMELAKRQEAGCAAQSTTST